MKPATNSKLSVIFPAYNKDLEVFRVVCNYVEELKHLPYDWEIIVVDDASKDKTLREAVRGKKFNGNTRRIKIFSYNINQGKGFALNYGFKKSSGDVVASVDSDLDLPSINFRVLLSEFTKSNPDIVIGSKRHPLSQVKYPITRRFLSKCYQLFIRLLFNTSISDTQVGLKVFKREVLEECLQRLVIKQFAFDLELLVVAKMLGYNEIIEAPIILNYNFSSTIRPQAIFAILVDTLAIYYRKNILNYYKVPHFRLEDNQVIITKQTAFI